MTQPVQVSKRREKIFRDSHQEGKPISLESIRIKEKMAVEPEENKSKRQDSTSNEVGGATHDDWMIMQRSFQTP